MKERFASDGPAGGEKGFTNSDSTTGDKRPSKSGIENLRVYQKALELFRLVASLDIPREWWWLRSQMREAAGSVIFNVREGWGRPTRKDRSRFFGISCGSANEVMGCTDALECAGLVGQEATEHIKDVADHVARMLTNLRKSLAKPEPR